MHAHGEFQASRGGWGLLAAREQAPLATHLPRLGHKAVVWLKLDFECGPPKKACARLQMGAHGQFLGGRGGWGLLAARWEAPRATRLFGRAWETVVRHEMDFKGFTGFSISFGFSLFIQVNSSLSLVNWHYIGVFLNCCFITITCNATVFQFSLKNFFLSMLKKQLNHLQ
jgi:hypothetical protein